MNKSQFEITAEAIGEWLMSENTGVSSKYIASVYLSGKVLRSMWSDTTPSDSPDLGRCVRLIEQLPRVRDCFPVLREASPVWRIYVDHWDKLTALWNLNNYYDTTNKMRELRKLASHP